MKKFKIIILGLIALVTSALLVTKGVQADTEPAPTPTPTTDQELISGCTDENAFNYDEEAKTDDNSCIYIQDCTLPLYEKDGEWNIVWNGASGLMEYDFDSLTVVASGLNPNAGYTLIEYPEPRTTWPWPIIEIVSGTTNASGEISLGANYNVKAGEKYWLVLTSHIVNGEMSGWNLSEYLFEGFLIPDNECLVEPTPSSEPEEEKKEEKKEEPKPASAPGCGDSVPEGVSEIWVESGAMNDNCVDVHWSPPTGADKAHIKYSEVNGEWRYALLNTENDGVEEICGLNNGVHYWFVVAGVNGCAVGNWSSSFDPLP